MASTSNQIDSSSSSTPRWNVFLSFRGKDTRKTFTGHLYSALDRAGIQTFMDNPELPRGEEISPQLLKAIEESKVSIVVFSKNYASSRWCLDELVNILECKRTKGQLVLPVFYNVDPSDVRHKTRSFAEDFESHKKRFGNNMEIVEKWEGALTDAANLSGYDLENDANGDEAKLIQKIVQKVLLEVNLVCLHIAKQPVGIESRVENVTPLLSIGTNDIRRIGIYGMGGIGKTTIAKALFNKNFQYFEGSCFLSNVREGSEERNGILRLQGQLLFDILKVKDIHVENVDKGSSLLKERLRFKKVLIVLDDLNQLSQSDQLAGQWNQFALGSRIIITTRDASLLDQIEVEERYNVEELDDEESLELFSQHAFKKTVPTENYVEISKGIVRQAGGLPLALEVLGSYLFKRTMVQWRSSLDKLEEIPQHEIHEKLIISYHALGDGNLKDVFLDIACFFIGKDKEMTIGILDSCGFNSENAIIILIERSLLSINDNNELRMHDILRDMGRKIVKKESPKEPRKRSRLWSSEDICNVLEKQKGTEAIEGIIPVKGELKGVTLNTKTFKKMHKLRLLDINNVHLTGNFEHVFEELRWLSWRKCNLQCLPSDFHPEKLVILDLKYSKINILWHGILFLEQLKILNLDGCEFLTTTPNFTGVPNLEKLLLGACRSLAEIHPSIGQLSRLAYLDLRYCSILRHIPNNICNLRALETLSIRNCPNLKELPEELGNIESLRELLASHSGIFKLPDSIGRLSRLVNLDLEWCTNLRTLPNSLCNLRVLESLFVTDCENLKGLPEELGNIESLRVLRAGYTAITKLPDSIGRLSRLVNLDLEWCRYLRTLPNSLCNLRVLESLCLSSCKNLEGLPEELGNIESLRVLRAAWTPITKLPDSIGRLTKLFELNLYFCKKLKSIPSSICRLPLRKLHLGLCNLNDNYPLDGVLLDNIWSLSSLESLNLSFNFFSTLPSNLSQLSNLKSLDFQHCRNLGSLSKLPPNLEDLNARGCTSMVRLPNLSNLKHLRVLWLENCSRLAEIQGLENLNSIEEIRLEGCNNLSISFTETFLQVYSGFGKQIDIYLPIRDFPDWFGHQILGPKSDISTICFDVPQNSENKFLGMILWLVSSESIYLWSYARVENKTNGNTWLKTVDYYEARSWVSFIPKTKIALKFGDKIEASISGDKLIIERFGVHCVYKTDTIEN